MDVNPSKIQPYFYNTNADLFNYENEIVQLEKVSNYYELFEQLHFKINSGLLTHFYDTSNVLKDNIQNQIRNKSKKSSIEIDSIIPITSVSLINSNSKKIDKNLLNRSNFFSPIHLMNYETNSFLVDLGLPSNFYELSLLQSENRSNSFFIDELRLNEPLTNLFDLRDIRYDEFESIHIIFPTRSFLLSRYNDKNAIIFDEWKRYSPIPLSRIRYIEAPYDNLFFDGMFNVNISPKYNFEFGVTKHNAFGRFINSEKDLWAGKLKLNHYFSNHFNFGLVYRYSKSLVRFNEGININNPFITQGQTINDILYDNQRALAVNDDAYHKWTNHLVDLSGLLNIEEISQTKLNVYFHQSLREYRDNERKADSIRIFDNHWSKVIGITLKENLQFHFNKIEAKANYERVIIQSPFFFHKVIDDLLSVYALYQIDFSKIVTPAFYAKFNHIKGTDKKLLSYGSDLTINFSNNTNLVLGASKFKKIYSYDERYFFNFNLGDFISDIFLFSGKFSFSKAPFNIFTEFYYRDENNPVTKNGFYSIEQGNSILNYPFEKIKAYGLKSDLSFSLWKLNSKASFVYNDNQITLNGRGYHKSIYPRYQGQFEIFYRDIFFKSSLDLLIGFRIKVFSSFAGRSFSPSKLLFADVRTYNDSLINFGLMTIPANFTIDIVASGRIKEAAIVYLSIENLLDRKFYLIPYYPTNDIQFRFGIAWEFYD